MRATRTLNPLPLHDLEPHRFEDLVRQLAYDFRDWAALEALGRSGSDEGMDVRGLQRIAVDAAQEPRLAPSAEDGEHDEEDHVAAPLTRLWVFQCKREKTLGPRAVARIIDDFFKTATDVPYGYVLAAACDFSKRASDEFKIALRERGVQEFYIWGRGEIEDQLVLPKNDHLLFAYFGISLQVRRAAARTHFRARLALKRRLNKILGGIGHESHHVILIRDPEDESYPFVENEAEFVRSPRWRHWEFVAQQPPDHLMFVTKRFHAYANWTTGEWDYVEGNDQGVPSHPQLYGCPENSRVSDIEHICHAFVELHVPEENRGWLMELRTIHYDRIIALDEIGDSYNGGPHLLVAFRDTDPFDGSGFAAISPNYSYASAELFPHGPDDPKRVKFFPKPIPDEREAYQRMVDRRLGDRGRGGDEG